MVLDAEGRFEAYEARLRKLVANWESDAIENDALAEKAKAQADARMMDEDKHPQFYWQGSAEGAADTARSHAAELLAVLHAGAQ